MGAERTAGPDSGIGVSGEPFTGTGADGEVRGAVDAHDHLFSNEASAAGSSAAGSSSRRGSLTPLGRPPGALPRRLAGRLRLHHQGRRRQARPVGWPTFRTGRRTTR
ncbi:hypothetical protein LT493_10325 [Streptomyces tricolor]|nr:hypothetical protein [Streptomyces tricolor]